MADEPISEEWLKEVGFKWDEVPRSPHLHWTLWIGGVVGLGRLFTSSQDLGVEISKAPASCDEWNCWFRADYHGRYSRFLHIRILRHKAELRALVEAVTGQAWDPANHRYGYLMTPEQAQRDREKSERLDYVIAEGQGWHEHEKDLDRAPVSVRDRDLSERNAS